MVNLDGLAVMDWRNEMMKIPDSRFIGLMHLYLGEIKTPYRKEALLSSVSEYFKNPDVRNDLFSRIDGTDSVIISAICLLKFATGKKLSVFLKKIIVPENLKDRLNNLEKRLLIYEKEFNGQRIYALNPIFPELEEYRADWKIFPSLTFGDYRDTNISYCSNFIPETLELFIAVFLFYTGNEGTLFKSTGELKKKFLDSAEGIFPGISEEISLPPALPDFPGLRRISVALDSLCNLGLYNITPSGWAVSFPGVEKFSALSPLKRLLFFFIGTAGNLTKNEFSLFAESLEFVFDFISKNNISPEELSSLFFCVYNSLLYSKNGDSGRGRRFSAVLLENSDSVSGSDSDSFVLSAADKIFSAALIFGVLRVESGTVKIFDGYKALSLPNKSKNKSVIVESVFSVSVLPGTCFRHLVKFLPFLNVISFQTVASFSLTRDSVFSALSKGYSCAEFITALEKTTENKLPSNFLFSFNEWVSDWNGNLVYSGPVLVVGPEKKNLFEGSKGFMYCVKKVLAPGVYLLKGNAALEAAENVKKAGFEVFIYPDSAPGLSGCGRDGAFVRDEAGLKSYGDLFSVCKFSGRKESSVRWTDVELREAVENNPDICPEQKKVFFKLIQQNLILSPAQINSFAVPFQALEVSGMDYPGKTRILENSLKKSSPVRITVNEGGLSKEYEGVCVRVEKEKNEVRLFILSDKQSLVFPMPRISKVEEIPGIAGDFF